MALNVAMQLFRGTKAALGSLASTGKVGVLAYTTDTQEIYVDSGTGTGIGPGNAWLRFAPNNKVTTAATQVARLALANQLLGDICVQTDTGVTYALQTLPASVNGNWTAIGLSAAPVTSVNTKSGAVVLAFTDFAGAIAQTQLPATIGAGSSLTTLVWAHFSAWQSQFSTSGAY